MSSSSGLMVERVMFYAMALVMLLQLFVPSLRCRALANVLLVLAFLYAVGAWWLLRRKGVWGFLQPFLIGWFGGLIPVLWSIRVAGFTSKAVAAMVIGLVLCLAAWIVAAWARKKVEPPLTLPFISVRMGLFMLFGAFYFVW